MYEKQYQDYYIILGTRMQNEGFQKYTNAKRIKTITEIKTHNHQIKKNCNK